MHSTAVSLGQTEPLTPRAALERLFVTERIQHEWFDSSFLSQIAISHLEQVLATLMAKWGAYQRVQEAEGEFLVILDQSVVPTKITLNLEGRITGLLFQSPRTKVSSTEEALQIFKTLSGRVGLLIVEDGQERISLSPDTPLAVGASFKLVVLAALKEQIERKWRSWHDVIELKPESKSLPTGVLQTWPDGAPLTLHTLATLMISQSDNTATDAIIDVVGRETLKSIAPRNRPFLVDPQTKCDTGYVRGRHGNEIQPPHA